MRDTGYIQTCDCSIMSPILQKIYISHNFLHIILMFPSSYMYKLCANLHIFAYFCICNHISNNFITSCSASPKCISCILFRCVFCAKSRMFAYFHTRDHIFDSLVHFLLCQSPDNWIIIHKSLKQHAFQSDPPWRDDICSLD